MENKETVTDVIFHGLMDTALLVHKKDPSVEVSEFLCRMQHMLALKIYESAPSMQDAEKLITYATAIAKKEFIEEQESTT